MLILTFSNLEDIMFELVLEENHRFVNWEHNRRVCYAGNPNYGRQLTQIRNNMLQTTEIKTLSDSIRKLIMSRYTKV